MTNEERIIKAWRAGKVTRFHTKPSLSHTVAHHSFGVALLAAQIYGREASRELLLACLYHDLGESIVGDLPYHTKRLNAKLAKIHEEMENEALLYLGVFVPLSEIDKQRLKFCDMLDLMLYCVDEAVNGNKDAYDTVEAALRVLSNMGGGANAGQIMDQIVAKAVRPLELNPNDYRTGARKELVEQD